MKCKHMKTSGKVTCGNCTDEFKNDAAERIVGTLTSKILLKTLTLEQLHRIEDIINE